MKHTHPNTQTTNTQTLTLNTQTFNTKTNPLNTQTNTQPITPKHLKQNYINETLNLIDKELHLKTYMKERLRAKVSFIYDEFLNQLVIRKLQARGNFSLYKVNFPPKIYNDIVFYIGKKKYRVWKLMQEYNPLCDVKTFAFHTRNKKEHTLVVISRELADVVNQFYKDDDQLKVILEEFYLKPNEPFDKIVVNSLRMMYQNFDFLWSMDYMSTDKEEEYKKQVKTLMKVQNLMGYIPHIISLHPSGRKYYRGNGDLNLQNSSKVIREIAFAGCQEIDINNCLNSYMIKQADSFNINPKWFKYYDEKKEFLRRYITDKVYELARVLKGNSSRQVDKRLKTVKRILSSLAYRHKRQGTITEHNMSYVKEINKGNINVEEYNILLDDPFVKFYIESSIEVNKQILKSKRVQSFKGNKKYKDLHVDNDISKILKKSSVLAFLYFEYETNAMKTAFEGLESKIRLSIHDGMIVDPLTKEELKLVTDRFDKMGLSISVKTLGENL